MTIILYNGGIQHNTLLKETKMTNFPENRDNIIDIENMIREADDREEMAYVEDYEDDGQPSEYDEWQDFYGGDDWDHGQYDHAEYEWDCDLYNEF